MCVVVCVFVCVCVLVCVCGGNACDTHSWVVEYVKMKMMRTLFFVVAVVKLLLLLSCCFVMFAVVNCDVAVNVVALCEVGYFG